MTVYEYEITGLVSMKNKYRQDKITKEEMKNIYLVIHFFEHLAVFEGDYSEYIYESEGSIKIY